MSVGRMTVPGARGLTAAGRAAAPFGSEGPGRMGRGSVRAPDQPITKSNTASTGATPRPAPLGTR